MKRALDLAIAIPAIVIVSPVIAAAAVAVKLESPGPAFYRGPRVGIGGRPFHIFKLRSMSLGADRSGPAVTSAGDARVTRVGRVLRATKLDELPQLWNVIRGDMSLVGPRPEHPDFVRMYTPEQRRVLSVRPGITSETSLEFADEEDKLAEAGGPDAYATSIMPRKLELDLRYVERHTLGGDVGILVRTAGLALRRLVRR